MKNALCFFALAFLVCHLSNAQDKGTHSIDVGGEFQKYPHGAIYNLHLALNTRLNHSFQFRVGYNKIPGYENGPHIEFAKGWGGGFGYRYYFKPTHQKFFVGGRLDAWSLKIETENDVAAGPYLIPKNHLIFQPAIETGYTFIINGGIFITPYLATGYQTLEKDWNIKIGRGFTPVAGVSAGIRF